MSPRITFGHVCRVSLSVIRQNWPLFEYLKLVWRRIVFVILSDTVAVMTGAEVDLICFYYRPPSDIFWLNCHLLFRQVVCSRHVTEHAPTGVFLPGVNKVTHLNLLYGNNIIASKTQLRDRILRGIYLLIVLRIRRTSDVFLIKSGIYITTHARPCTLRIGDFRAIIIESDERGCKIHQGMIAVLCMVVRQVSNKNGQQVAFCIDCQF